jgi:hypothetical protein
VAKAACIALLPVSYRIGVWLLEGPLQGLFRALINGPVTAWCGFEYYATTGGLVLGLGFGVTSGLVLNRLVRAIRTAMAGAEEHSERYQKYAKKWWVRLCAWLFLGKGKGKRTWQEMLDKKVGNPIRISGAVLACVAVASLWTFQQWFSTPILTGNLRSGLEAMNGATVDLKKAQLDLAGASLQIAGLAIADNKSLDKDLLAADELVATIDTGALLRKRFVIDELKSTSARAGTPRTRPGRLLPGKPPPPEPPPPPAGTKTVEDYLQDFEVWKGRLEQAQEWIEVIAGDGSEPPAEQTPEQREADRAEQRQIHGTASVAATHLFEAGPRVLIRKIDIEGIEYSIDGKVTVLDLRVRNVSDEPSLVTEPISASVGSQTGDMLFALRGGSATTSGLGFECKLDGLLVDDVFGKLKVGGKAPLRGGTMNLAASGSLAPAPDGSMSMDLPLQVALKDSVWALAGAKETKIDSLLLPVGLRGPVSEPRVSLDDKALQEALVAAGQRELANFVQQQGGKLLGGLPTDVQGIVDPNKAPEQIVDDAKKKADEEAKRLREEAERKAAEKAAEEAKKRLPGLFPPK